uniref:ORP1 n=1 Tax=Pyricularia grisea TaxID=148305 RepID=Q96V66_PYRGI|nr:ORP1 [Pyricularia grisea]
MDAIDRRTSDTLAYGYQPGHKRSASAPDFPAVRARYQPSGGFAAPIVEPPTYSPSMSYNQSFNMFDQPRRVSSPSDEDGYGEETASSATRSDQTVPTTASTVPATQPWENPTVEGPEEDRDAEDPGAASDYDEESTPRCLFGVRPCDTGSQLRKAVSHIFGRNKLCTRQIPDNAWVHYCRKHYQRSRYRAGPDYSLTQIGLVIRQINKIRNWSDYNVAHNRSSGVVTSWRLQLRKREEKRRETKQQLSQVGKKRRRVDGEGYEEDEEDDEGQPGSASRNSDFATQQGQAPPQWLIEKLGDGYTTDEVLGIARRLKDELEAGTTRLIPDIEILPNITSDRAEEPKPRTKPQRRAPPQPSRVPPSRSRLPPYGYGHRSTLSESSRGASHLDHLQDVVGMSHWDNPSKRQRGTEYGQVRNPWGQQPTTTLLIRSSNDPSAFGGIPRHRFALAKPEHRWVRIRHVDAASFPRLSYPNQLDPFGFLGYIHESVAQQPVRQWNHAVGLSPAGLRFIYREQHHVIRLRDILQPARDSAVFLQRLSLWKQRSPAGKRTATNQQPVRRCLGQLQPDWHRQHF